MKKIYCIIATLLSVFPTVWGQQFDPQRKIRFAEQIIENYYVDTLDMNHVVEEGIIAMLKTLDPHSTYTNAAETKELTEPLAGNFSGIGIQFNQLHDTIYVIQTIAGGPSEKCGIVAGDRIISSNDTILSGVKMTQSDIRRHLRGPKNSVANLKVLRKGVKDTLEFRVVRDDIPIYSVDASYMADDNTGYIRVSRFAETTPKEVAEALQKLVKAGMTDLILDLQDNGGGYLGAAYQLSELFLENGAPIVYTEGVRMPAKHYLSETDGPLRNIPVVVLVNQYSASASEILSGALQDNDRGVIVGRRTFGKGLVQRPFPLPDGSMIRLTTMRYYTPSGRSIQKPYTSGDPDSYREDILDRFKSGELMNADSIQFADSLLYHTLRLKRPVYGGGGIMPDRFVALDTTQYTPYYRSLVAKGIMTRYADNYIVDRRKELKSEYKTEDRFIDHFEVTEPMMQGLVDFATSEGVEFNEEEYQQSYNMIATILKAIIGRDLFTQSTYFRVANSLNPIYVKGLETLNDGSYHKILK